MKPVIEISLKYLRISGDWAEVFGEESSGGNTSNVVEPCVPGSNIMTDTVLRKDVSKIIAAVDGENEEDEWIGVFLLKDGRYLVASGSCDYTGWDCQARNLLVVAETLKEAIMFGLSESQAGRLGLLDKRNKYTQNTEFKKEPTSCYWAIDVKIIQRKKIVFDNAVTEKEAVASLKNNEYSYVFSEEELDILEVIKAEVAEDDDED